MTEWDRAIEKAVNYDKNNSVSSNNKEDLRKLGIEFLGDKIKKACQNRLNIMFANSYRNIEIIERKEIREA